MCVLIVDDESDIRDSLEEFFTEQGYSVWTAPNGAVALEHLAQPKLPCVVILDLIMPILSGNDVIEHMQKDARLAGVPIIITTSDPSRAPAGVPILKKPMNLAWLLNAVKQHCGPRAVTN